MSGQKNFEDMVLETFKKRFLWIQNYQLKKSIKKQDIRGEKKIGVEDSE